MARSSPKYLYLKEWKRLWEPDLEAIAFNGATCDPTRVDPKVLQWVRQHCAQKPHFVKVIIQSAAANESGRKDSKLVVPAPFVQQHFRNLERVVKLENEDGKTWKVTFGPRPTRHPSWQQGWHRFALDNHLKSGDVLVFVLAGVSHFHYTHFHEDGNPSTHNSATAIAAAFKKECNTNRSQSHDDSEDEPVKTRASKLKQSPSESSPSPNSEPPHNELVSPNSGVDHHSHVASLRSDPSKMIDDPQSRKTKRLCKVGEKRKERVALDSEEGDPSTSMTENATNGFTSG